MATTEGPSASSPTAWRRWLALELRRLRTAAGKSQADAGKACGCSGARISLLEVAGQNPTADDLEKLLPLYGVPAEQWPAYFDAIERAREKGWWDQYGRREVPDWFSLYLGLEQGASSLKVYEPNLIHGLLQAPRYATEVLRRGPVRRTDAHVAQLVELRTTRQAALIRESPVELEVVMDENALHRRPGNPEVMQEQLQHLAKQALLPNVTIQVLPRDTWVASYASNGFVLLKFPWTMDPGVLYLEHRNGAFYLEDQNDIDAHDVVFQEVAEAALTPEKSLDRIRDLMKETKSD